MTESPTPRVSDERVESICQWGEIRYPPNNSVALDLRDARARITELEAERDAIREGKWSDRAAHHILALERIKELQAERAAAPQVECPCHPGVRWPAAQWGKPCPLSELEANLAAQAARLESAEEGLLEASKIEIEMAELQAMVGKLACSYCGHEFPTLLAEDVRRALAADHMRACPKHPLAAALRHISATADTLSPQEFINVCADALGVDRHQYAGECDPNLSIYELNRRALGSAPAVAPPKEWK